MGDERKEEEIEQEYLESYEKIHKRYIATIFEDVNNEFDKVETSLQKFIYAALTRAREEVVFQSEKLAKNLDYIRWIVNIQKKHDCGWYDIKDCLRNREIKLSFPKECKEIAKQNIFSILIVKHKAKITGEYKGKNIGINCICKNGHKCCPEPASVLRGRGICIKCNNNFDKNKADFYENISKRNGKIVGKYQDQTTPVKCICVEGHICYPIPTNLKTGKFMCRKCVFLNKIKIAGEKFNERVIAWGGKLLEDYKGRKLTIKCTCPVGHICYVSSARLYCRECCLLKRQSRGELKLRQALEKMGFDVSVEFTPKILDKGPFKSLRFDAAVTKGNKIYLFEYHGSQHEKRKFNQTQEEFEIARQRDLVKVYMARKETNTKMIILDYKWVERCEEHWINYLTEAMKNPKKIIAESPLHKWIHETNPSKESILKWTNY